MRKLTTVLLGIALATAPAMFAAAKKGAPKKDPAAAKTAPKDKAAHKGGKTQPASQQTPQK